MRGLLKEIPALLIAAATAIAPAAAKEPWQLSHGPFTTAADVREHNRLAQDIAEISAALDAPKPDWQAALTRYAYGKNFAAHSLARFADDYNGRLANYLPVSTRHFGAPHFQNALLLSALAGTGRFASASEAERRAYLDAGMVALVLNWCRYELGEAERKAKAAAPNWALTNGAPKNWNEVFAFYYGPEGRASAFAAVAALPDGFRLNDHLFSALAEGQTELVAQRWAPAAARKLTASINSASIALLRDAIAKAAAAPESALGAARAKAAGFWLAAAEIIAADPARAKALDAAFAGKPDRAALEAARVAIEGIPND